MKKIAWWRTTFGEEEIEQFRNAILNERISMGAITEELERRLSESLETPYTVVTTSGSVALLMALMALDIGPGDEVIVPNRTWIATAHAVLMAGAKVVLVDVLPDLPIMDIDQVKRKISKKTKAIMPVHLNGRAVDMTALRALARRHNLKVIEDACQALYSRNKEGFLGTQSDAGCFSLGVTKLISTGQGGFVVTKDRQLYEKLKFVRNHGVVDQFTDRWNQIGFNFKFTDLLASLGLAQLMKTPSRIKRVQEIYSRYESGLKEIPSIHMIPVKVKTGEIPLYAEVLCEEREALIRFLLSQGIQVRPFPPNLHTSDYLGNKFHFPNSIVFADKGLYLPCGPEQPLENIDRVIQSLTDFLVCHEKRKS